MGCCGSKEKEVQSQVIRPDNHNRSTVKTAGSNNIRLPKPLKAPYPNDEIDVQKYLTGQLREGTVIQPDQDVVPMNLNEMAN